jgi:hypothetical protein
MKATKVIETFLFILVVFAIPIHIFSQGYVLTIETESLKGLQSLNVVVEDLEPDLIKAGLTRLQIQTDVEIKLRRAGIKLTGAEKYSPESYYSYLYIRVSSFQHPDMPKVFAFHIEATLNQSVILERNKSKSIGATWKKDLTGIVGSDNVRQVRDHISDVIDLFINNYLKANGTTTSESIKPSTTYIPPLPPTKKQDDSPFTATYVGGNSAPTVEIFNDSNRTMYFDFGQEKMIPYTILSGEKKKITISEGIYNYKASAPRVRSDEGQGTFQKGYVYTWRFFIVTVPR